MVSLLTEGLVKRGIDVTLFATADSHTAGKLHAVCPSPYEEDKDMIIKVYEGLHISEVFERANEFDIIHNHFDYLPLTYSGLVDTPVVTTIHGFSSRKILPVYKKYNNSTYYVSISDASRCNELDYIATVRHGIDIESFPFKERPEDYLLFISRIHRDKGAKEAIEVAKKAGMKLKMAGFIGDSEYFRNEVEPQIDDEQIIYEGHVSQEHKKELLSNARALLHMINYEEAFGLGVVEALTCGTPVIAINRGAMPELIMDGETGFLVNDVDEAVEAVQKVNSISRRKCRKSVEKRFSVGRMVDDYIRVYETILEKRKREAKRPWGFYEVLTDKPGYKVKRITVLPQEKISLQRHSHRKEHWYIISGEGVVTKNSDKIKVLAGDSVDLPIKEIHRIKNTGSQNLVFIEISQGEYIGEDDIERLEDKYGRA
ncbi:MULTISPECIES: glycosyltransferase [unclassified Methanosarcina]|uniref:glycosyltransferase n=1 Tax=unclassified Methanosarcina TaxID=2644672 RepID=UPI000615F285|nr:MULTISPECIES: glycosyltransferase [unclassified Methanosarcina]AKB18558.1 Mannose-6-phosphate isomerase, bifunctional enzyme [Methanosarcina sp. WWM596]AKB21877.1 Mannose-6-phosphate isomerase, bifunctional enzyme [Methanosarcina sp. WH1]